MRPATAIMTLFFAFMFVFACSPHALAADKSLARESSRADLGSYAMCGADLVVTDNARFTTGFAPDPASEFNLGVGLWVGAHVDRGSGVETLVSTSLFNSEFFSVENPPARTPREDLFTHGHLTKVRDIYTPDWLPNHNPLGLEVVQESHSVQTLGGLSCVDVNYTITNISSELSEGGWSLEDVYLGVIADPDVGANSELDIWTDDFGGFRPGAPGSGSAGASRGDLAYVYDEPGDDDDTTIQVGVVLRGASTHRFAIWSGGLQDPSNDMERYSFMRGTSDDVPTIDPSPVRSADYRVLLSVGPLAELAPGESTSFAISIVCGDLVSVVVPPVPLNRPAIALQDLLVPAGAASVQLHAESFVDVWSVTGRRVATVRPGRAWDLRVNGVPAAAGVYFYGPTNRSVPARRIVLLR